MLRRLRPVCVRPGPRPSQRDGRGRRDLYRWRGSWAAWWAAGRQEGAARRRRATAAEGLRPHPHGRGCRRGGRDGAGLPGWPRRGWLCCGHGWLRLLRARADRLQPRAHRRCQGGVAGRAPGGGAGQALASRWLPSTLQGWVGNAHLPSYLNESCLRCSRRAARHRGLVFLRLLGLAVAHGPVRRNGLIPGGEVPRRRPPVCGPGRAPHSAWSAHPPAGHGAAGLACVAPAGRGPRRWVPRSLVVSAVLSSWPKARPGHPSTMDRCGTDRGVQDRRDTPGLVRTFVVAGW
jgi:hypothetical protein